MTRIVAAWLSPAVVLARVLALALTLAGPAEAIPVQWTLQDVEFADGGLATGSFRYDADLAAYSAIAVVTTPGTSSAGGVVNALLAGDALSAAFVTSLPNLTGVPLLQLLFQAPLTNAGGVVGLVDPFFYPNSSSEGHCTNATCSTASFARFMVSGNAIGTPIAVPLPSAGGLLVAAIAVFARRTHRTR